MTNNYPASGPAKLFRSLLSFIDIAVYTLLGYMYEIFFNVASADIFANGTVLGFYKRVQLIIGVYMVFQLAILIMKGIFNPDNVSAKNNGEFVKRIITALVLLTIMTPIAIPNPQNEYEKQINNNGLLFGTLYSLQYRILRNNTIGRLVLGTNDTYSVSSNSNSNQTKKDELTIAANTFSSTILKGFFRINLVDEKHRKPVEAGKPLESLNENRMCKNIDKATKDLYLSNDTSPGDLLSLVNATCTPNSNALTGSVHSALSFFGLSTKTKFVFAYMPVVSTVVAIAFIFILISLTVDIAVRAIKLAVLRLVAPIPIISYMDPNGSKDGGFSSWVKTLSQTYLDLFIRLAVVYFVVYLIQDMIANGIYMNKTSDAVGIISFVFICIGLFMFAKEAPKFFQQAIGMKNEPVNIFGQALGRTAAILGAAGSFNAARIASREADITNGGEAQANRLFNRGKHLLSGIVGGVAGLGAGLSAADGAKDHRARAAFEAQQKRNAMDIARGRSGSTFFGRFGTMGERLFTGQDYYERESANLKAAEAQDNTAKELFNYLEGKGKTDGATYTVITEGIEALGRDAAGNNLKVNGSLNEFRRRKAEALAKEQRDGSPAEFEVVDNYGVVHRINAHDAVADKIEEELGYAAGTEWAIRQDALPEKDRDLGYTQKRESYETAGGVFLGNDPEGKLGTITVSKLKKVQKRAQGKAIYIKSNKRYMRSEADHGATGGKK